MCVYVKLCKRVYTLKLLVALSVLKKTTDRELKLSLHKLWSRLILIFLKLQRENGNLKEKSITNKPMKDLLTQSLKMHLLQLET